MTRFVIVSSQRTGSNFLEQALDTHPDVHCFGELLLGIGGYNDRTLPDWIVRHRKAWLAANAVLSGAAVAPGRYLDRVLDSRDESAVGFRLMYNQLRRPVDRWLRANPDLVIVHLHRRNVARQVVSRKQMHTAHAELGRPQAHSTTKVQMPTIDYPVEDFRHDVAQVLADRDRFGAEFGSRIALDVAYEDLVDGSAVAAGIGDALCELLGVEPRPLTADLVRTGSRPLSETLENYDELVAGLDPETAAMLTGAASTQ